MCQQIEAEVLSLYQSVCDEWVNAKWWFTAYNVSKEVQKRGGKKVPRHAIAGKAVHPCMMDYLGNGQYNRTPIDLGQAVMPFLFHPTGADVAKFQGQAGLAIMESVAEPIPAVPTEPAAEPIVATTTVEPVVATEPVAEPPVPVVPAADPTSEYRADASGRLNIKPFICKAAGFNPDDAIYFYGDAKRLEIVTEEIGGKEALSTGSVVADGRIRVAKSLLQKCDFEIRGNFQIEGEDKKIIISQT